MTLSLRSILTEQSFFDFQMTSFQRNLVTWV